MSLPDGRGLLLFDATAGMYREALCDNAGQLLVSGATGGGGGGTSNTTEVTQLAVKAAVEAVNSDLGAPADAVATTDTGTFSITALIKRGLQRWTSLLAILPASLGAKASAASLPVVLASDQATLSVAPVLTAGGHISVSTAVSGTGYTAFGGQACKQITICNGSGIDIGVTVGGAGVEVPVFAGTYMTFFGLTNANQLHVRRVDTGTVQVPVTARWES